MSYFVNPNASISDITGALNYALANLGGSVSSNLSSGQISSGGNTIGYLYQYMNVAFATSFDGVTNFSTTSFTNATYFGLRNTSTTTVSSNPADYVWYQVAGGFGTTKYLWYNVTGGRNIQFSVQTTAPAGYYVEWTTDPINLDIITSTLSVNANLAIIYQWTSGSAPARPTITSTYTWATNTFTPVPSGWSSSLISNTTPGAVLWEIQVPISANVTVPTSLVDWTNTSYPIVATSANGATGATGANGANGLNAIYAYLVQNQSLSPPTFTSTTTGATAPSGWSLTPPTGSYIGQVFWYIFGQYNSSTITINGIAPNTTLWTGPTAASIFEDIESDNWNGSVPPTYGTPSTYGTTGYYISRNTGDVYFNNGIFRGNLQTGSSPAVSGSGVTTTMTGQGAVINVNGSFAIGNSTANIASDGTAVVLNGFVNGTGSSSVLTGITSSNQTVATIIPSKTTKICFGITGEMDLVYQSSVAPYPDYVYATYTFYLYQGSTLVKTYSTSTIMGGGAKFTSSVTGTLLYIGQLSTGFSLIDVLPFTGGSTYTLQINGSRNWYSSTSGVLTPVMTGGALNYFALNGNSFYYQAG